MPPAAPWQTLMEALRVKRSKKKGHLANSGSWEMASQRRWHLFWVFKDDNVVCESKWERPLGRGEYTQSCFRGLASAQLLSFPHLASTVDWVWTCALSAGDSVLICRNCSRPAINGSYPISFIKSSYRLIWGWLLSRPLDPKNAPYLCPLCFPPLLG